MERSGNVVNLTDIIVVEDTRYAPHMWREAFLDLVSRVESTKGDDPIRFVIAGVTLEYSPRYLHFRAYGAYARTLEKHVVNSPTHLATIGSPKSNVLTGIRKFVESEHADTWCLHFTRQGCYSLLFGKKDDNTLGVVSMGRFPEK